ncbi:DUF2971 domain-containing protein [Sphingomonas sp. SUN039]|uniref:DUF2971 domain-containing protein n=1 Tax=Sphingomonas sp. SUN039 TaxID=2937787 RepID=UPI002164A488|nr:DUF2971 domain-containing protein [Sphingomonas sp. SUN039]UVO54777.1 DUF2971 domain-containing protein [Sphingomonas sp. SUN039]
MVSLKSPDKEKPPREISHYTTLEGLKGIVESGSLWASNASFLNDRAELEHALSVSERVIQKLSSETTLKAWSSMLKRVFKELNDGERPNTYVACFCRDDDNLSQWRGYGGTEQGVSITFGRASLAGRLKSDEAKFLRVSYSKYSTVNKVHSALEEQLSAIADLDDLVGSLTAAEKYDELRSRVSALLPRFKHIGFQDEREWRFVIQRKVDPSALQFRVSKNKIVPFIVVGSSSERLPITAVRIGPGPDQLLTAKSVQAFLAARGYDVPVRTSEVPFRP